MGWLQFALTVGRSQAEDWADALLDAGATSVQAEDADADSLDEQPIFGEPGEAAPAFGWCQTRLTVLVAGDADPQSVLATAATLVGIAASAIPAPGPIETIADQDWVRATQSQFEAIDIGRRLRIAPSWQATTDDDRLTLIVDPGLAFGTGSHPTTRLCLEWLDMHLGDHRAAAAIGRVIDYGCGSGILAIAAARLGARDVRATDVDPQAVATTAFNAGRNGATVAVGLPEDITLEPADLVLANILSNPLKLLAPLLTGLVAPGGTLVLSGVLERQADEVASTYAGRIAMTPWRTADGWACLVGRR